REARHEFRKHPGAGWLQVQPHHGDPHQRRVPRRDHRRHPLHLRRAMARWDEWWPVALLAALVASVWLGSRFESAGHLEAVVIAFGFPLIAIGALAPRLRDAMGGARVLGIAL